ncbi:hypothetical protein ACFWBF_27805 [Streptomyces sp. NPDC060028]|uniref:hypothetical protein n=1 Tax=Streptomyces sp. NPDC060028 TaxID=3347041 RepID=UPI00368BC6A7
MSEIPRHRPRRRRPLRTAAGLLVLLALAGYLIVQRESNGGGGAPYCTASVREGADPSHEGTLRTYEMTPEQAGHAATIAAVGVAKGLPDRAVTIALATAMQESSLRNLDHGDRDSLGLFQQRPSQGWGTPGQIMDPVYSAGIFYDHLAEIKGYSRLPLTVAAQRVQRSGFPQAYAKHEPDAIVLTAAFAGGGEVACGGPPPAQAGDPQKVRAELTRIFGKDALQEMTPERSHAGAKGMEIRESEILLVEKQDAGEAGLRAGQAVAQWAVAHAREMDIARVSYSWKSWIAGEGQGLWQFKGGPGKSGDGDPHNATPAEVRIFVNR